MGNPWDDDPIVATVEAEPPPPWLSDPIVATVVGEADRPSILPPQAPPESEMENAIPPIQDTRIPALDLPQFQMLRKKQEQKQFEYNEKIKGATSSIITNASFLHAQEPIKPDEGETVGHAAGKRFMNEVVPMLRKAIPGYEINEPDFKLYTEQYIALAKKPGPMARVEKTANQMINNPGELYGRKGEDFQTTVGSFSQHQKDLLNNLIQAQTVHRDRGVLGSMAEGIRRGKDDMLDNIIQSWMSLTGSEQKEDFAALRGAMAVGQAKDTTFGKGAGLVERGAHSVVEMVPVLAAGIAAGVLELPYWVSQGVPLAEDTMRDIGIPEGYLRTSMALAAAVPYALIEKLQLTQYGKVVQGEALEAAKKGSVEALAAGVKKLGIREGLKSGLKGAGRLGVTATTEFIEELLQDITIRTTKYAAAYIHDKKIDGWKEAEDWSKNTIETIVPVLMLTGGAKGLNIASQKTEQGMAWAKKWAGSNPSEAKLLAGLEQPSRNDFKKLGISEQLTSEERAGLAANVREALLSGGEVFGQTSQEMVRGGEVFGSDQAPVIQQAPIETEEDAYQAMKQRFDPAPEIEEGATETPPWIGMASKVTPLGDVAAVADQDAYQAEQDAYQKMKRSGKLPKATPQEPVNANVRSLGQVTSEDDRAQIAKGKEIDALLKPLYEMEASLPPQVKDKVAGAVNKHLSTEAIQNNDVEGITEGVKGLNRELGLEIDEGADPKRERNRLLAIANKFDIPHTKGKSLLGVAKTIKAFWKDKGYLVAGPKAQAKAEAMAKTAAETEAVETAEAKALYESKVQRVGNLPDRAGGVDATVRPLSEVSAPEAPPPTPAAPPPAPLPKSPPAVTVKSKGLKSPGTPKVGEVFATETVGDRKYEYAIIAEKHPDTSHSTYKVGMRSVGSTQDFESAGTGGGVGTQAALERFIAHNVARGKEIESSNEKVKALFAEEKLRIEKIEAEKTEKQRAEELKQANEKAEQNAWETHLKSIPLKGKKGEVRIKGEGLDTAVQGTIYGDFAIIKNTDAKPVFPYRITHIPTRLSVMKNLSREKAQNIIKAIHDSGVNTSWSSHDDAPSGATETMANIVRSVAGNAIPRYFKDRTAVKSEVQPAPVEAKGEAKAAPKPTAASKAKVKPIEIPGIKDIPAPKAEPVVDKEDESPKDLHDRNFHQKMVDEYRHIFEGDLPARVRGGLPAMSMGHLNIKPIKATVSRNKSKVDSLSNIMSKEQGRYAINGVFHDATENRLVATDGKKIVVLEEKIEGESRTVNPKTNETLDGIFPKWQTVIPKSYDTFPIDAKTLHEAANGALKAGKLQKEPSIFMLIKGPGKNVLVNPQELVPVLQVLREQGAEQVGIGIAGSKYTTALVLTHKKNIAVVLGISSEAKGNDYGSRVEFDITKGDVIKRVDEGPRVEAKVEEKAPDDVKHKIHVVRVNGGEIKDAFPGATVERAADGKSWSVTLQGGGNFRVELRSDIPVDVPTIMSTYDVSRKEAEKMAAEGAAGAVQSAGIEISLSDGKTYTPEKIIALFDPDKADRGTVRHEALHLAKKLGLFDTPDGKRIWGALSLEYGSEEKIANAREAWEGQDGLWQRIRQWASVWLAKLGFDLDPDVAMAETFSERFWSQGGGLGPSGVRYSLRKEVALTSIKNDVVEELRRQRGEGELDGVVPEVAQQWLDDAVSTLALDNNAGNRLVTELDGNARILSPRETALLQMYYRSATNNFERVSEALFTADRGGDPVKIAQAQIDADLQMALLAKIEEVAQKAGSEWGRAGVARQIVLAKDFSMGAMVRKMRVANGGKQLSTDDLKAISKQAETIKRLEGRLKEMEAAAAAAEMKPIVAQQIAEDIKSSEASKPKSKGAKVKTKKAEALLKIKNRWEKLGNIFTEVAEKPDVAASGMKFQLKAGDTRTSDENIDPVLYEAAKELAEVYIDDGMTNASAFWNVAKQHLGTNASQAESTFRKAWSDAAAAEGVEAPELGFDDPRAMTREARMIQRQLVDAGMTDHKQILNAVHEAMQDSIPELTLKDTMAILSAYGQFTPVSKDDADVLIRDMNGQLLELSKLEALSEGEPLQKTGQQRPEPTQDHRRLIQQVYEAKKQAGYGLVTAKTAINHRIEDLNWEIKHERLIVKNRTEMVVDAELMEKRKERDELLKLRREIIPAKKATDEQKIAALIRWHDKAIADLTAKLEAGDISPRAKGKPLSSLELDAARADLKALRAQRQALRDLANPKKTKEERDRSNYEANLRRRIADYTLRKKEQDFERKPKEPRKLSNDEMKLKRRLEETKQEFLRAAGLKKLENMSPAERTLNYTAETMYVMRAMMTSFDVSAVYRQGGAVVAAHPLLAKKAYAEMAKAMVSKQANFKSAEDIRNDPLYQFSVTVGLSISDENGDIVRQEEINQGRWAKRVPGVAASGRAYATFLNNIRFGLFKLLVANIGKNGQVTVAEGKVIANYINVATGRGDFKALNKAAANLNHLFFATRWVASRFQYMVMPAYLPFTKTSWRVKKAIAKEYARTFTGAWAFAGTLMALGYLAAGDDEEEKPTMSFDPRSSDFLKIKIGETRIDPFFGLQQALVVSAKLATGEKANSDGKVVSLTETKGYNADTRLTVGAKFLRTKLAPIPGAIVTAADDMTDVVGRKHTPFSLGRSLVTPLSFGEVANSIEAQGVPKGTAISILTLHGVGAGTYGPRTRYLAGSEEEKAKQFKNDLTNAEWNDKPLAYSDQMTEEMLKKYDVAKQKHGGRMLYYLTLDKPDLKAYTKRYKDKDDAKDRFEDALKEWDGKQARALESLKGFPKADAKDYLRLYRKSLGYKAAVTNRDINAIFKKID
jgi:hypothetical protein